MISYLPQHNSFIRCECTTEYAYHDLTLQLTLIIAWLSLLVINCCLNFTTIKADLVQFCRPVCCILQQTKTNASGTCSQNQTWESWVWWLFLWGGIFFFFWNLYFEPIEFKGYRKRLAQYNEEISFKVTGQVRTIQKHYAVSEFTNSLLAGGLQHWPFS